MTVKSDDPDAALEAIEREAKPTTKNKVPVPTNEPMKNRPPEPYTHTRLTASKQTNKR